MTAVAEKLCECGCGEPAPIAAFTRTRDGWAKGRPKRFVHGHRARLMKPKRTWTVNPETGCWEWDGRPTAAGYGRTRVGDREGYAHRWSWLSHRGPIPDGHEVHHRCENPICINPDHLEVLTEAEHKALHLAARNRRRAR